MLIKIRMIRMIRMTMVRVIRIMMMVRIEVSQSNQMLMIRMMMTIVGIRTIIMRI